MNMFIHCFNMDLESAINVYTYKSYNLGKRIEMTLIDFGVWSRQHNTVCEHYANLVERSTGEQFKVCGGNNRMQNVYTSKTSTLEIEIASALVGTDRKYFLLKYACKRNSAV